MKHTHSHGSVFSDFPARLAYFEGVSKKKEITPMTGNAAEVKNGTESVPSPDLLPNEEAESDARLNKQEENIKSENEERNQVLPEISKKIDETGNPTDRKETQKEEVDAYYKDAIATLRPPMHDIVELSIQNLNDPEKAALMRYTDVSNREVYASAGISFVMSPGEFGGALAGTLRFSVFTDKAQLEQFRSSLDPNMIEVVDSLNAKISDTMGDELDIAKGATQKMKDAATEWANDESNKDVAQEIRAKMARQLQFYGEVAKLPEFKQFVNGMRARNAANDSSSLTAETIVDGSKDNTKEKGIEKQTRTLQAKMLGVDADIKVQGTATLTGKEQSFGITLENMDQNVKDVTLKEANRQFEKDEMKIENDQLTLSGTEAIEFMNFLRRMNITTWSDLDKKKEEKK